jgi:hypothetical protein
MMRSPPFKRQGPREADSTRTLRLKDMPSFSSSWLAVAARLRLDAATSARRADRDRPTEDADGAATGPYPAARIEGPTDPLAVRWG